MSNYWYQPDTSTDLWNLEQGVREYLQERELRRARRATGPQRCARLLRRFSIRFPRHTTTPAVEQRPNV
jgi:hypothetical protein